MCLICKAAILLNSTIKSQTQESLQQMLFESNWLISQILKCSTLPSPMLKLLSDSLEYFRINLQNESRKKSKEKSPTLSLKTLQGTVRASDISREKKATFRGIFRGKFAGFAREKSPNSRNNRAISGDFRRRKVKIRRKIGPFHGILAEKSQFLKDFRGQILRKIGRFHGKFRGETSPRNNQ